MWRGVLAVATGAVAWACAAAAPPAPVDGCAELGFSLARCELVVAVAARDLPLLHPSVVAVRVRAPSDRQDDLSGIRAIVANVDFAFTDGSSRSIAVDCVADADTPACTRR